MMVMWVVGQYRQVRIRNGLRHINGVARQNEVAVAIAGEESTQLAHQLMPGFSARNRPADSMWESTLARNPDPSRPTFRSSLQTGRLAAADFDSE